MPTDIREEQFEKDIENILLHSGYLKRNTNNFDRKLAIDSELFLNFLKDSQPNSWCRVKDTYGLDSQEILRKLTDKLNNRGMMEVLRHGFQVSDIHFDCIYFRPVSHRNPESEIQYSKNVFSVIRQVKYSISNEKAVDLVLFINGFPLATVEVKNPVTGQSFQDAIRQYVQDRDPMEKLFEFKTRALVHFAVDPFEVHLTTHIKKDKTIFLPFNKGRNDGRGNPDNNTSYRTSYLWEEIWQKDVWLKIISDFINLQVIVQKSPYLLKENLIFPRYHQLRTVLELSKETKKNGPGVNYLIQHSTGSGKSNTIAWLAYTLFSLHGETDKPIFDSVIVLSDRVGIVNQLTNTIKQFEQTTGTVEAVKSSTDLSENLKMSKKILISTQQKFPFVLEKITKVKGKNFAIIIDEAHSSQTGQAAYKVKKVLTTNLEEAAKVEAQLEEDEKDLIDRIEDEMKKRGSQRNLSYYAFTATPKKKTLRLFGTKDSDENYVPFDLYSMKQAIEEGFILDVLKNYTTYERHFMLVKIAAEDKVVEGKKASRALMNYIDLHHLNLSNKAKIIVEHFRLHSLSKIGGLAKAMVISSSRIQAFRYKQEIDEYVRSKGYQNIKTLVAFSGSIKDDLGNNHTEQSINNIKTEEELRDKFNTSEFNILIVAEKYQTGYNQPLLHTMYVDRKLRGIKVVQTLSRLNRTHPGKTDTFVIDFQNLVSEITHEFEPFYKSTVLIDKTNPTYLFSLYNEIIHYDIIRERELETFAAIFFKPRSIQATSDLGKLYAIIDPVLDRFYSVKERDQDKFKEKLIEYIEAYSFLTQIIPYDDTKLEKLFVVAKFIANENILKGIGLQMPQLKGDVSLKWYRLEKTHEGDIVFGNSERPLIVGDSFSTCKSPDIVTTLSLVIQEFNERFSGDVRITDADTIVIEEWIKSLENDVRLRDIAQANEFSDFLRIFESKLEEQILNSLFTDQFLVSKIFSDSGLKQKIIITAATYYHKWARANNLPPITPGKPLENRILFRQTIRSCKGFLYWIDLFVGLEGIEFLLDSFDFSSVKDIKILTSLYNNENQINEELHSQVKEFQRKMKEKGISLQMRIVSSRIAYQKVSHDRFILSENVKYNVPSFTTITKGRFSEIKKTTNSIPFQEYWDQKDSLDIINNWIEIKNILLKSKKYYNTICSNCKIHFQIHFKPDGIRPIYCIKCKNRY